MVKIQNFANARLKPQNEKTCFVFCCHSPFVLTLKGASFPICFDFEGCLLRFCSAWPNLRQPCQLPVLFFFATWAIP